MSCIFYRVPIFRKYILIAIFYRLDTSIFDKAVRGILLYIFFTSNQQLLNVNLEFNKI